MTVNREYSYLQFAEMEGGKAVRLLLLSVLIFCWNKGTLSEVNNSTACFSHPTGEVAFHVQGVPGPQGPVGEKGATGGPGLMGPKGDAGQQGRMGAKGDVGAVGAKGQKGEEGQKGGQGEPGDTKLTTAEFNRVVNMLQRDVSALHSNLLSDPCTRGMYPAIPASSCKEIHLCRTNRSSGYYWIITPSGPREVYCLLNTTRCGSVGGGWMRVGQIDMTNPLDACPSPLRTVTTPKRMCAKQGGAGCSSVLFNTHGVPYTEVCGQAIGYQFYTTDAFAYRSNPSINSAYLDGISITYGMPRQHLWSYAIGIAQSQRDYIDVCPCASSRGVQPPSFVQGHYYCESAGVGVPRSQWYTNDPLWDGEGCPVGNTCCNPPNQPWFHRRITTSTTDNLEVRWCRDEAAANEDIGVELLELYTY